MSSEAQVELLMEILFEIRKLNRRLEIQEQHRNNAEDSIKHFNHEEKKKLSSMIKDVASNKDKQRKGESEETGRYRPKENCGI